MTSTLIKCIICVENFLCIYRNYCFFRKPIQKIILIRIILEMFLIFSHLVLCAIHYNKDLIRGSAYIYLVNSSSIMFLILPVYHSTKFKKFISLVKTNKKCVTINDKYAKEIKRKEIVIKIVLIVVFLWRIVIFLQLRIYGDFKRENASILSWVFQLSILFGDFRLFFEFISYSSLLDIIAYHLSSITEAVGKSFDKGTDTKGSRRRVKHVDINILPVAYVRITEMSEILNSIFGVQITYMIISSVLHCISFFYFVIWVYVKGKGGTVSQNHMLVVVTTILFVLLFKLSRSAHHAVKNVALLKQRLCKRLIASFPNDAESKSIRSFLRLVESRPIRAQIFGSIHVDMTLLPTCLALFTSYTLIALQFNNVV